MFMIVSIHLTIIQNLKSTGNELVKIRSKSSKLISNCKAQNRQHYCRVKFERHSAETTTNVKNLVCFCFVCLFVCLLWVFCCCCCFLQRLAEQTLIITYSHDMSHESETHREHNKISSTRAIRQFSEADGRGITELTGKSGKTTNSS